MSKLYFILFFVLNFNLFGQNTVRFTVVCKDQDKLNSVYDAKVEVKQNGVTFTKSTDKSGQCFFELSAEYDIEIKITHGFYGESNYKYGLKKEAKFDTELDFEVFLAVTKIQQIDGVKVYPPGVPQIVYESKKYSVSDFEILKKGEILLLLYPKTLKKGSELAVLSRGEIASQFELPEKPIELIHDFRGTPHVVCENGVFGIHQNGNEIGISTIERNYFMKYIFPIVDTSYSKFYFSNFNKNLRSTGFCLFRYS
jgi:hypothetical protein